MFKEHTCNYTKVAFAVSLFLQISRFCDHPADPPDELGVTEKFRFLPRCCRALAPQVEPLQLITLFLFLFRHR